jgi:HAD superfamily hydrolase (TIGR01549 family)
MKTFSLNKEKARALIFDIDLTLYDNLDYYNSQERLVMEKLAHELERSCDEVIAEVIKLRDDAQKHQGKRPTLGGTIAGHYGFDIREIVRWREELFEPEQYLDKDHELQNTLAELSGRYMIAAVTNNPASIARRTLKALDIERFFKPVIGLDSTYIPKPSMTPYKLALENLGILAENVIVIGDRYEVDIELPVQYGMGGILVETLDEVRQLNLIL